VFYFLSKVVWFFLKPSNLLLILGIVGVLLSRRFPRLVFPFFTIFMLVIILFGVFPTGYLLLHPLENQFAAREIDQSNPVPAGIIILGGAVEFGITRSRKSYALSNEGERVNEGIYLALQYPSTRIIINDRETYSRFTDFGISSERIILERKSKNTYQNATYAKSAIGPDDSGSWIVITSAYHMPRAVGSFRSVGLDVIPWPVDFRTTATLRRDALLASIPEKLDLLDLAAKEWVGLIAYRVTGRTSALLPGSDHPQ
jgi:uncharacterized SAM-binding protein YcdF (DUF218 family)